MSSALDYFEGSCQVVFLNGDIISLRSSVWKIFSSSVDIYRQTTQEEADIGKTDEDAISMSFQLSVAQKIQWQDRQYERAVERAGALGQTEPGSGPL